MLFQKILVVASGLVVFSIAASFAAPVSLHAEVVERGENNIYGRAHSLKIADDEYKKRAENNIYGIAHTFQMADDELKKRGENRIYGIAQTLKMADDGYKKCEASNIHETAHALKMDENEFKKRGENSFMEPPTLEDGRRVQSLGIAIQEDNAGGEHYPNFKKHL